MATTSNFVDYVKIYCRSGAGGAGLMHFRHEKFVEKGGHDGGNGRMGRLWQTLLLMQWKPIFAWIPVETIVKEHQHDYYAAIAQSDHEATSTPFITFMLQCLKQALNDMAESNQKSNQKILAAMKQNPLVTIKELQTITGLSESGVKKVIRKLRADGAIQRIGGAKGGHWELENKIDFLVYKLYGLSYDEVLVVDPGTGITRDEYEKK